MKLRGILILLLTLSLAFLFIACNTEPEIVTYTISFDSDGGTAVAPLTVEEGRIAIEPAAPTKEGYVFDGWYIGDTKWDFSSRTINNDVSLKAKWKKICTVTFMDGSDILSSAEVSYGSKVTKPADPEKDDHVFLGWYAGESLWIFEANTVSANITLKAKWIAVADIPVECTVKFDLAGGVGNDETNDRIVTGGAKLTEPKAPTRDAYAFVEWQFNGQAWDFDKNVVTGDMTLTAVWKEKYTVSFDTLGGSEIDSITVIKGELADEPEAPEKDGFAFIGWLLNGEAWSFETPIDGSITLTAEWEKRHAIIYKDVDGTEILERDYVIDTNEATKPADPQKIDSLFIGWYSDVSLDEDSRVDFPFTPTADVILYAKWVDAVSVTFDTMGASNYSSYTVMVEKGTLVERPSEDPTFNGFDFIGWGIKGSKDLFDFSTPITESIYLEAKWEKKQGSIMTPPDEF